MAGLVSRGIQGLSASFRVGFAGGAAAALLLLGVWQLRGEPPAKSGARELSQLERRPERVRASRTAVRIPDPGSQAVPSGGFPAPLAAAVPSPKTEDYSYSNIDPRARQGKRYAPAELAVLEEIIALNRLTEDSSSTDFDDGDGVLEPLEFGTQVWCGGHLRELYSGPSEYVSFGYELERLPPALGDLRYLTRLSLSANRLAELPASIGELRELRALELYHNQLRELPEALGQLQALELLQLRGNQLRELPRSLADLPRLSRLFVADNPIGPLPEALRERAAGAVAPAAQVVRRNVDCSPES